MRYFALASLRTPAFWLGSSAIGVVLVHLTLLWQLSHASDQLLLAALFWLVILRRLWRRRSTLWLSDDLLFSSLGLLLLLLLLFKSLMLFWFETSFIRVFLALASLSLGLLASGKRLVQYWREFLLLMPLLLPPGLVEQAIDTTLGRSLQILTAQTATFVLHYIGFQVVQRETIILMPQGAVEVMFHCTGVPAFLVLGQLAILTIASFKTSWQQRVWMGIGTVVISFLLSSVRVSVMAIVVADNAAFDYWHGSAGSQGFSTLAVLAFAGYCRWLLHLSETHPSSTIELG